LSSELTAAKAVGTRYISRAQSLVSATAASSPCACSPYAVPLRSAPPVPDVVLQEQTEAELDCELAAEGVTAQTYVIGESSPARGLHRVAEHEQASLIVVGSTHHGAVGRAFAGDDAAATIHRAPW
jgi:nucleotide-binding universal stress UspA family protein